MIDPNVKIDLMPYFSGILNEAQTTYQTVKERGARFFARPIIMAALTAGLAFKLVYQPPGEKLKTLDIKSLAAETTLMYADRYVGVRDKLLAVYPELPGLKDRDEWLVDSVNRTMKVRGIVPQSIKPATESDGPGLIYQEVEVTSSMTFLELMRWIKMIEDEKPLMHVESLSLRKADAMIGVVDVTCKISSIIVARRFAP